MEEEYKRLIEEIRDAYFLIQQERIVLVSNYTAEHYGYSKDELIGKPFSELIAPEERERLSEFYISRIAGEQAPERYETLFLTKDGAKVPGEVSVWLTRYRGQPAVAGIIFDITEHKRVTEELRDSEEKYRSIIDNSPDIIYTADAEGKVLTVNNAVRSILGYDPEELIGRNSIEFIPKEVMPQVLEEHNKLVSGNKVTSETLTVRKDGLERHLEFRSSPFMKDGRLVKTQGVIRDITDHMRVEEKLRRMFESVTDGVTVTDLNGVITECNEKTAELHGYESRDKLLGKNAFELISQCDHERAAENMQRTMELGLIKDIEYSLLRKDGSEFCGELSASMLMDAFGKPEGFIAITRDITERKQTEEKYRQLLEDMNDGYGVVQNGKYVFTNSRFCEIFGYEPGQMTGKPIHQKFTEPDARQAATEQYGRVMRGEEAVPERHEAVVNKRDGTPITVETTIKLIEYVGKPAAYVIVRDITDRKQAEEKYRQLLEDMNDGYAVIQDGKYTFVNRRFGEIFELDVEHVLGKRAAYFAKPKDRQIITKLLRGKKVLPERYEAMINRKDGTVSTIEMNPNTIEYEGKSAVSVIYRDITKRKQAEEKYRQLLDDMHDGYLVIKDGKYAFINDRFCEIFGYEPEQILGYSIGQLMSTEDRQAKTDEYTKVMRGEQEPVEHYEGDALRGDGKRITVESSIKPIQYEGEPAFCVIIRDITERKKAEEALRESAEMLRLMFECAPYGVVVMDLDTTIIDVNDQTLKLCGVSSKSEILGISGMEFVDPSNRESILQYRDICIDQGLLLGTEHPITRPDGSHISVETSAGVLKNIDGDPIGLIAIGRDVTYEKELRENKQFYITEIIKALENERRSLARALHDDTIQELLLATHRLHDAIAGNHGRLPKRAKCHLEDVRALIERIVTEVRGFTTDLRPDVLDDMGLIPALRWLANRLIDGEGINARLSVIGKERRLPSETELTLFRVAQEALSNVRKHACASTAQLALQFGEQKVALSISDNGQGFELPSIISHYTRQHKLGLTGIAERVRLLDGRYKIESSPGRGTVISVEIDG
ncbi:PAS domain S-box protein [Chloroflexota bacterium]